jgi:Pycsar effector protein
MSATPAEASHPDGPRYSAQAIHVLRTQMQATMTLSQMADQKAGLLMAATFVVFSIAVGQARGGAFPLALLVLAVSAFLSALFAVIAVLPSIRPSASPANSQNLLFFGAFSRMSEEDFAAAVLKELHTDETLFRLMLRDIHQNGQVLRRKKYRYIGVAYRIFIAGLTLTLITFLIENRESLLRFF